MYYWQSETYTPFTPEGDWHEEREKYGSYDGTIKPKTDCKGKSKPNKESLDIELGYGIRREVINRRLKKGWSIERAVNTPLAPRRTQVKKTFYIGCEKFTFSEFARHIGVTYSQLTYKFRKDAIAKTHWQEWEVAHLIERWYEKFDTMCMQTSK